MIAFALAALPPPVHPNRVVIEMRMEGYSTTQDMSGLSFDGARGFVSETALYPLEDPGETARELVSEAGRFSSAFDWLEGDDALDRRTERRVRQAMQDLPGKKVLL